MKYVKRNTSVIANEERPTEMAPVAGLVESASAPPSDQATVNRGGEAGHTETSGLEAAVNAIESAYARLETISRYLGEIETRLKKLSASTEETPRDESTAQAAPIADVEDAVANEEDEGK